MVSYCFNAAILLYLPSLIFQAAPPRLCFGDKRINMVTYKLQIRNLLVKSAGTSKPCLKIQICAVSSLGYCKSCKSFDYILQFIKS